MVVNLEQLIATNMKAAQVFCDSSFIYVGARYEPPLIVEFAVIGLHGLWHHPQQLAATEQGCAIQEATIGQPPG